jgi:ABC-2 type transport system permease protein
MFHLAKDIQLEEIDPAMDEGRYTFVLVIPDNFEKDVIAGR